jgi:hypothetical protein
MQWSDEDEDERATHAWLSGKPNAVGPQRSIELIDAAENDQGSASKLPKPCWPSAHAAPQSRAS